MIDGCEDAVILDAGSVMLSSLGRILQLDVTVKNVCPNKRVALAVILTEVDQNGNVTSDQMLGGGLSYVKNDNIYEVKDVDVPTNSAKLNIEGRDVWVFSKYLREVSNN